MPRPVRNVLQFLPDEAVERQKSLAAARLKRNQADDLIPR